MDITAANVAQVNPQADYAACFLVQGGRAVQQYGIVSGESVPGILARSTKPSALIFKPY